MLARLPRIPAILMLALIALACAWALTVKPPPVSVAKKGGYTDMRLYHDIAAKVATGTPYHQAAASTHRAHNYPLKPFFTMRLPTLSEAGAHLGWPMLQKLAYALLIATALLWVVALENAAHLLERALVGIAVLAGGGIVANQGLMALHEVWGGMFIALALAVRFGWERLWPLAVVLAGCGLMVRELVLPFVLLSMAFAGWQKRWAELAAWAALVVVFAGVMAVHAHYVAAVVLPSDIPSPGWHAAQGFTAFLKAVVFTSVLAALPLKFALLLAMLPLFGWLAMPGRGELFGLLLFAGYALMIALFSRADTFYWGGIVLPGYFIGIAFLPRALRDLWMAARG